MRQKEYRFANRRRCMKIQHIRIPDIHNKMMHDNHEHADDSQKFYVTLPLFHLIKYVFFRA